MIWEILSLLVSTSTVLFLFGAGLVVKTVSNSYVFQLLFLANLVPWSYQVSNIVEKLAN